MLELWEELILQTFKEIKDKVRKNYHSDDPEEVSPNTRALIRGAESFPCPVDIVDVRVDNELHPHLRDKISQLILYDLSKLGSSRVTHHGIILSTEGAIANALVRHFRITPQDAGAYATSLCKDFKTVGLTLVDSHIQFTFYDAKKHRNDFRRDLFFIVTSTLQEYLIERFRTNKETDFNALHNLEKDPILPRDDFLRPDSRSETFSLEELQSEVSNIQLINEVPESV